MNGRTLITALDLPPGTRVDQRVPKKLLLENGAPTSGDRRLINEGVEEMLWVAALKPTTVGIPAYRDAVREYLEIAILRVTIRADAKAQRLVELVHRAVPYPALLVVDQTDRPRVSAAHKRRSQGEAGKMVLDGEVVSAEWAGVSICEPFPTALALGRQPQTTLFALYQGWLDTLHALLASKITGSFKPATTPEDARAREEALKECARLEAEVARVRAAAKKESQLARQVGLNLELKRLEAARDQERRKL